MSCGCNTSGDSHHSCGTKSNGCEKVDTCGNSYKLNVFDWLSNINIPQQNQNDFVEIRFKNDRKCFYQNVHNFPLHIGSIVTVESSPGHDIGVVSLTGELVKIQMKKKNFSDEPPLKIYRLATQKDIETWQEFRNKEDQVKIEARKIARNLGLEMKITDVEYQGDGVKAIFYYTAENRVDFRQLIKDFATAFKTKIDMKQIGYRQESAKVGGIGSCGRELCCSSWLTDFRSVNTNAARYQQLSINPVKLAGQCGKLKCCLNFELDSYVDALSNFPSSNTILDTEKGRAYCIKIDVFKKKMWFAYVENSMAWYDLDIYDVKKMIEKNKKGEKTPPLEDIKVVDVKPVSADLIQENSVDRFEKKNRNRNPKQKQEQRNQNTSSREQVGTKQTARADQKDSKNKPQQNIVAQGKSNNQEQAPANKNPKNRNFKKKYPPKKNDNG